MHKTEAPSCYSVLLNSKQNRVFDLAQYVIVGLTNFSCLT